MTDYRYEHVVVLQVLFGTTDGQIIVMSATGAMLTQVIVNEGNEIVSMLWSCEKFNMDETESKSTSTSDQDFITTTGMWLLCITWTESKSTSTSDQDFITTTGMWLLCITWTESKSTSTSDHDFITATGMLAIIPCTKLAA